MERLKTLTAQLAAQKKSAAALLSIAVLAGASALPAVAFASSWDPTLLVNTESFMQIDEGDGTSDIELQFGPGATAKLLYRTNQFIFLDDTRVQGNLAVEGNVSASGSFTVNADNVGDAIVNFVRPSGADQTLTYSDLVNVFQFSSGATFAGAISGTTLTIDDLKSCEVIETTADGRLQCSTSDFLSAAEADGLYVNQGGDTMTGTLNIINGGELNVIGDITTSGGLTINDDGAGNATLTFGDDVTNETITFNKATDQFEFSDDIRVEGDASVTGTLSGNALQVDTDANIDNDLTVGNDVDVGNNLSVQGNMSGDTLTVDSGTVSINGVGYSFTGTQGAGNTFLRNDGAGGLTWVDFTSALGFGSGAMISLHPEYPNAVYAGTGGTADTGAMRLITDDTNNRNYYQWSTSRPTDQYYDIITRIRVPENFNGWQPSDSLSYAFKTDLTTVADNAIIFKVIDTAGSVDYDSGELASTVADTERVVSLTTTELNGTYTAGSIMTIRVTMKAESNDDAHMGYINLNWNTTTP